MTQHRRETSATLWYATVVGLFVPLGVLLIRYAHWSIYQVLFLGLCILVAAAVRVGRRQRREEKKEGEE